MLINVHPRIIFPVLLASALATGQALAVDVTIQFDKVKVTAAAGAGADLGYTVFSVEAIGDGPFKTKNGAGPLVFRRSGGPASGFLNGFTGATIVANQFDWRYFGSVAAPKGSIFTNGTGTLYKPKDEAPGFSTEAVKGKDIVGFEIKLAQPVIDDIKVAEGGNAFKKVKIADDKDSASFSDGLLQLASLPAVGNSGEFLWSFITEAPQPKFPQVMFTEPKIPPDPAGEFKTMRYVGKAVPAPAVPEPGSMALLAAGLLAMATRARRMLG